MLLLEVVEPVAFDAPHLSHPPVFSFQREAWQALVFRQVESSLPRRRDFDITAWVAAALPAAAASWRWSEKPLAMSRSSEKWNLHLWHQGNTFQQAFSWSTGANVLVHGVPLQRLGKHLPPSTRATHNCPTSPI